MLEIRDLTVHYGTGARAVTAVDAVSLLVPSGGVVGLVGGSGSGKSTVARAVVGLAPVAGGAVLLDDVDLTRVPHHGRGQGPALRKKIQLVFQDPYSALNPRRTVGSAVAEALDGAKKDHRDRVRHLLELVQLSPDLADVLPGRLSGGQRQRIVLARALAVRPRVLIADEVTSALDVSVQGAVLNLLRTLQRELGFGMLFISHNLAVVRYVSDVIAVMRQGRVVELGDTEQVTTAPRHDYTRQLLAATPTLTR